MQLKEITVISGKGGTGKTSIVGSLAYLAKNKVIVDCDVDAADLHLILRGTKDFSEDFIGGIKAKITQSNCIQCGICKDYCRYDAIKENIDPATGIIDFSIDELVCEGCGVCASFCPDEAIELIDHKSGSWFTSTTKYGPLVHAKLGIAEANSGKLVSLLRKQAKDLAIKNECDIILVDGSPGIGCPVIASITGADYALIITEPTVSAIHDMERLFDLTKHFGIRCGICINKYDINRNLSDQIELFAKTNKISILSRIPYDENVTKAQIKGVPYLEYCGKDTVIELHDLWNNLNQEISLQDAKPDEVKKN